MSCHSDVEAARVVRINGRLLGSHAQTLYKVSMYWTGSGAIYALMAHVEQLCNSKAQK